MLKITSSLFLKNDVASLCGYLCGYQELNQVTYRHGKGPCLIKRLPRYLKNITLKISQKAPAPKKTPPVLILLRAFESQLKRKGSL